jgi:hypothetical protein
MIVVQGLTIEPEAGDKYMRLSDGRNIGPVDATDCESKLWNTVMAQHKALFELLDAIGALSKPHELQGMGFTQEQQEEILAAYRLVENVE